MFCLVENFTRELQQEKDKAEYFSEIVLHDQKLISNKMEETKTWVLERLIKEREFVRTEVKFQCDALVKQCFREEEIQRQRKNDDQLNSVMENEKAKSDVRWMEVMKKEMQRMRDEWLKEEKVKTTILKRKLIMAEEKIKDEEKRRVEGERNLEEKLKQMSETVLEMEKAMIRMESERLTEREEIEKYKNMAERKRVKDREQMRKEIEMLQRERVSDQEEFNKYREMIQRERQEERKAIKEYMETTQERLRLLEGKRTTAEDQRQKMEQERINEKKEIEKYIQEEESVKLELQREMWWMRTEQNQDKKKIKVLQEKYEARTSEVEQMRTDMEENLTIQKEQMEQVMKDREQMRRIEFEKEKEGMRGLHLRDLDNIQRKLEKEKKQMSKKDEREREQQARNLQRLQLETLFLQELAEARNTDVLHQEMRDKSSKALEASRKTVRDNQNDKVVKDGQKEKEEIKSRAGGKRKEKWSLRSFFRKPSASE